MYTFKAARERAANSFFSVKRPRLRKQNYIKNIDRSALDKDLLLLIKALANKIPLNEDYWELLYIIERYKRANVDDSFTSVNARLHHLYRIISVLKC